ncbi:MAG: toxin-antitoxin system YwqK family antitoxin [Crocinitomicaceae bacterium]
MKLFFLTALLNLSLLGFSQFENEARSTEKTDQVAKCRDPRFRMVSDCANTVYFDEDQEAVMHRKSGKAFSGSCKVCHSNGNLEMYITYQGGKTVGQDTVWYSNGIPQLIRSHAVDGSGKEDGSWKLYRSDGSLKWEKNYVQGAPHGEFRYYYPDSSLWKIETWNMGQLDGKKQEFYPNNTLKKEIMYKNGEWNGKYITYFENGMVESEQMYENGVKEGLSKYYYEDGALFYEEYHEKGSREGEFRRFYPKEQRKWTVENYKKDKRHGLFEEYYDSEKNIIKYRATYKKGTLLEEHFYDEFGDETAPPKKPEKEEEPKEKEEKEEEEEEEEED